MFSVFLVPATSTHQPLSCSHFGFLSDGWLQAAVVCVSVAHCCARDWSMVSRCPLVGIELQPLSTSCLSEVSTFSGCRAGILIHSHFLYFFFFFLFPQDLFLSFMQLHYTDKINSRILKQLWVYFIPAPPN